MISIRPIHEEEWDWLLTQSAAMGGPRMLAGGFLHNLADYPALVAEDDGEKVGFIVYRLADRTCHVIGIMSVEPRQGVGSEMLCAVEKMAAEAGKSRVRISATNDNLPALRFLQLRGYHLRQMFHGAAIEVRKLRGVPTDDPVYGVHGIEIRDEIILNKDI